MREWAALAGQPKWHLDLALYEHQAVRDQVADALAAAQPGLHRVVAGQAHPDWLALEQALADAAAQAAVIQVVGLETWLDPHQPETTAARLRAANLRREAFAQRVPVPVLFWLRSAQVPDWVAHAPDLWAWRSAVHRFVDGPMLRESALALQPDSFVRSFGGIDNRSADVRRARVDELQVYLASTAQQPVSPLRLSLGDELADLWVSMGAVDEALNWRRGAMAQLCERLGDPRETAVNRGKVADILHSRGQLDEALWIHQKEQLPFFDQLGDVRAKAVTQGRIADILQVRGQLDEALRIRKEEELPVYERLGDARAIALTQGKIADVLEARGDLDEALRVRQEDELPVYESLGDEHSKAVTMGQVADILQERGQLEAALRIRREEQLPVYERLGDVRAKAVTLSKIADILQARGQLYEAMALHEQQLPVVQALGDIDSQAQLRFKLAMLHIQRGALEHNEGLAAVTEGLAEAMRLSRRLERPDYIGAIGVMLAQLMARGEQYDEALGLLREAEAAYQLLEQPQHIERVAALREAIEERRSAS